MKRALALVVAPLAALLGLALLLPVLVVVVALAATSGPAAGGGFGSVRFRDDFAGSALGPAWSVFNGDDPNTGPRAARNVSVHDGLLDLVVAPTPGRPSGWGGWAGASLCACTASAGLYGRYQVRAMSTTGANWRRVALTWPDHHPWPPELDFLEATSNGSNPVTTHWPDPTAPHGNGMQWGRYPTDLGTWHTYGVEWTPSSVVYTLDGAPQVTHTGHVPAVAQWLGLTAAMPADHSHPAAPQHYLVDWVQVDNYAPPAACTATGTGPALAVSAARAAGFPEAELVTAVAIAGAESGYTPTATNHNTNGSTDYGLWQINSVHADLLAGGDWRDPAANARVALSVYQQAGNSWTPWTTYNTGAYRDHLAEAQAAVSGGTGPVGCGGPGGDGKGPTASIPCAAGVDQGVAQAPGNVPIRLCDVGGILVNTVISGPVAQLQAAATAAGLDLGGGAFRSMAEQIALRKAHCGTSYYAIWQMPASQCSPPTAIPGQSMHEWGLAWDVTSSGHLIASHSDPAWQWLDAHAAAYGLHNLASEPWHFSTNGR